MTRLFLSRHAYPLARSFSISRGAKTSAETILVSLERDGKAGRGESVPYARYGESLDSVEAQIESLRGDIEGGLSRTDLQSRLPAGAARCAIDCAMWDLEAKTSGQPVWQLAGLPEPVARPTAYTVVLASPADMAEAARTAPGKILKVKLGHEGGLDRLEAIAKARPDARLIVDANEALSPEGFAALSQKAVSKTVVLIEQPFPADADEALLKRPGRVAVCADESAHTAGDLQQLARKYDAVNIKLDKTGGLTAALEMAREARQCGLGIMVGCMVASSISMAPAMLLGTLADLIDLDGPQWLAEDVEHGLRYENGHVHPPRPELWG